MIIRLALLGALALPLASGPAWAQEPVVVTTDKASYIDALGGDSVVRINVTGLDACVGENVDVGLFAGLAGDLEAPAAYEGRVVSVAVAPDGTAAGAVPILWEHSGTGGSAGVRGACVPGGIVLGEPLIFLHVDPPFGPVLPPQPLPPGTSAEVLVQRAPAPPDGGTTMAGWAFVVMLRGFDQCAGRSVAYNVAPEDGGRALDRSRADLSWSMKLEAVQTVFPVQGWDLAPGRYIIWFRSVCTGTWVVPGIVEIPATTAPVGVPPLPPDVGMGVVTRPTGDGNAMRFAGVIAGLIGAAGWLRARRGRMA